MKTLFVAAVAVALISGCTREAAEVVVNSTIDAPVEFPALLERAKKENKLVLLDFTGSDWCPPCMQLNKNVLSTKEFESYAATNLVFAEIDFPRKKKLSAEQQKANEALGAKFDVEGLPTLVLLDGAGKELWRTSGYGGQEPEEMIALLEKAKKDGRPVSQ